MIYPPGEKKSTLSVGEEGEAMQDTNVRRRVQGARYLKQLLPTVSQTLHVMILIETQKNISSFTDTKTDFVQNRYIYGKKVLGTA